MKQTSGLDSKRRAAGERNDEGPNKGQGVTVGLIDESEVPTVARAGKKSVLLETPEWKQACELLNKGLPDKKVLQIPLSAETLKTGKTPKHAAIGFKRQLMNHAKRMNWRVDISLKGESLFVKNKKK
ncbi:MAG: hypothetical protein LAO78_26750 [Acidobacteriia bacterium]|nr:hypothetical protein [Terriglobia bacterium]